MANKSSPRPPTNILPEILTKASTIGYEYSNVWQYMSRINYI